MKKVTFGRLSKDFGIVGLGLATQLSYGAMLASPMTVEFSGVRAQKVYLENFGDLMATGPIDVDGVKILQKQKEVHGGLYCIEKTKLNLYDPSIQYKSRFKCTLKLTDSVEIQTENPAPVQP